MLINDLSIYDSNNTLELHSIHNRFSLNSLSYICVSRSALAHTNTNGEDQKIKLRRRSTSGREYRWMNAVKDEGHPAFEPLPHPRAPPPPCGKSRLQGAQPTGSRIGHIKKLHCASQSTASTRRRYYQQNAKQNEGPKSRCVVLAIEFSIAMGTHRFLGHSCTTQSTAPPLSHRATEPPSCTSTSSVVQLGNCGQFISHDC